MNNLETAAKKYSGIMYDRQDYEEKYFNSEGCDRYDAFIAGAKSQAAKDQLMQDLLDDIEMNLDDWCRTPLVMATKFRDKQFKQEKNETKDSN